MTSYNGAGVWPETLATDWCYRFKPKVRAEGYDRKFTDDQVIECVKQYDREILLPNGTTLPRSAIRRTQLIAALKIEFGVTYTPALRRIEKLVRRGTLVQGDNPWPKEGEAAGLYVWMGDAKIEPKADTSQQLIELLRQVAPSEDAALSVRGVTKAVAPVLQLSSTAIHRRLLALVATGQAIKCEGGYYAASVT